MKRKKAVKTIMGEGIPRNIANRVTAATVRKGISHTKGTGIFLTTYAMLLNGQSPAVLYQSAGGGSA